MKPLQNNAWKIRGKLNHGGTLRPRQVPHNLSGLSGGPQLARERTNSSEGGILDFTPLSFVSCTEAGEEGRVGKGRGKGEGEEGWMLPWGVWEREGEEGSVWGWVRGKKKEEEEGSVCGIGKG